jgi:hypothetical protein
MHHTPNYKIQSGYKLMQNALGTLEHANLGEQVYDRIATALLNGQMRPNDKLTIRGLADQLGVSSTPVRDAIKQLTCTLKVLLQNVPLKGQRENSAQCCANSWNAMIARRAVRTTF